MKKMENTRSHSWWWDSHICPKNSKWLQENLTEMDSKVSAMLRIIEEDADSFAQRAEMYYKKRPELINLVEEFYRTYRALVERYTYLTREIRQNMAPALQAQLGVSSESAQNSPVDLHLKRGIDGPDIISPSYSYTGASEFDYDSPSEVSIKGQTDDDFSPLGFRTNYERRAFGFKPRFPNLEESSQKTSESVGSHGTVDVDIGQLQKEFLRLQEENKELACKSTEDATKQKNLQLELSSLQSKVRSLEAEDKLTKKRLKFVQEKEQKLEAENLKLSHALISSKEERTDLLEQQKKVVEDSKVAEKKIALLEDDREGLQLEVLTVKSQRLECSESLKKSEEAVQKLQLALTALEEERFKDSFLMEIYKQQSQELLNKISDIERKNASLTDEFSTQAAEVQNLQKQLAGALEKTQLLEQALYTTSQEKAYTEQEKSLVASQVKDLQKEMERTQKEREQQASDIARLKVMIQNLEEEGLRVQSEKLESAKYVCELETSIEVGQRSIETLLASCQQYEDRCKAIEVKYDESNERLLSSSQEMSRLQQTLEDMVASSQLQSEKVSSLVAEKSSLMDELQKNVENVRSAEGQCAEMQDIIQDQKEEIEGLQKELEKQLDKVRQLEEDFSLVFKEKIDLMEKEAEAFTLLKCEHIQLQQQVDLNFTLTQDLTNKLSCSEVEKTELALEIQQMQQSVLELQTVNTVLSGHCLESKKGLEAAEAAARKVENELALSLSQVEKLQEKTHAKGELLSKMMSDVETLEAQIAKYREENSSLGKEYTGNLAALGSQNNDLNSRLSSLANLNTALAKQVCEKEKSMEQLNDELAAAQRQVVALREDIELKTSQALDLQQEMNTVEKQMELVHTELLECSLIKESLEAVVEELRNDNSETKVANQALVCEQQRLLNDVSLLKSINQDLEATISHLKREKASLQEEAITHSTQCNDLKQRIVCLETDYEAVVKERMTLQSQFAELEDENAKKLFEAEGRVQDLQLKLSNMLAEEASLAEQLAERIGHIHTLDTALFDLQKDNSALSEEIGRLQQQASSYRTREASLLSEMHESSDFIQALSTEIEKLKRVVLNAEETEKRFSLEQHKALEECVLLQQKIETLQQDLEFSCEEKAIFLRDIASHSGRSSELECEVKRLEAEKDCLQQELLRAQQAEHYLREDVGKLDEERQRLSGTLDLQREKIEELQAELNCIKDVTDKMNLLAEEKLDLLQKLKEREQELEEARQNCLKLQSALQKLTSSSNIEMGNKMEEVRVLQQNSLILQAAKFELEQKLELWSRQALAKEDKEKTLAEMLAATQQEISKLELHVVDAQRRVIETNEECEALKSAVGVGTVKNELEQELQEEDNKSSSVLKMQQELRWLQDQKDRSDSELEAAVLQGHEYSSKLSSLQEQLLSAENLKLEMAEQYSNLTEGWGAAERKMQEEILQLRLASFQEKNELELQHKHVLELEDEVCQFQAEKKALLSDKACVENQKMDLRLQLADLKSHLVEKQEDYSKVSAQAELLLERVSLNENINLELQKQVQLLREDNQELTQKLQSSDGELVQLKAYLEILEGGLLELQERLHESQRESKLKEVTCQVQAEENVLLKEQNRELTRALSKVREEYTNLETKLAADAAALKVVKHELFLLKEEKGEGQLAKVRETSLCASQDHSRQYFQLISKIEDVEKMLISNLNSKQASVKYLPFMSQDGYQKKQVDLHQTVPSLEQTFSTEVLADRDSMIQEGSSSSSETMTHDQEVHGFDAMVNAVDRLKKSIFILLNGSHQAEIITLIEEQQEQVSCLQEEIEHLNLEVKLYQDDIYHLKKNFQGEKFQEEGEAAHEDVRVLQAMLYNLQGSLVILEEKVKGLKEEVNLESEQKRSLQLTLTDLQVEGLPYVLLLRKKLLLSCKGLRLLANEWSKKGCSKESKECLEKLSRAEALCSSSDIQEEEKRRGGKGEEHLQLGASQSTGASTFLLEQLKKRVEECSLLCETVEDMLLPTYWQDQCKDKQEQGLGSKDSSPMDKNHDTLLHPKQQGFGSTSKESKDSSPMKENHDALLHPDQQVSTEHIGSEMEVDMEGGIVDNISEGSMHDETEIICSSEKREIEGGIVDNISEGSMHDETEIVCSSEKREIDLMEGLAQLHINLGMRLHQALMDEKLENELQELKEEREKLKDDLQARVEQVQSMEAELEKLQVILKEGKEGDQQKEWLQQKKRAEKRARKLSRELVLQRQHVGNLQDAVVAWTQQQELATQMLEKQVLFLVSQECSPTMEGWDATQVSYLMQEMQSRKALTRKHSMDLQSVGQELQRVGSSIETTQRQLLKEEVEEQEANQAKESVSPDVVMNHRKLGLTWLLLLFTTGRRRFLKRSSKDTISATKASPKQVLLHRTSTSTLLSSLLAHTRKMSCCACAPRHDQLESLDAK